MNKIILLGIAFFIVGCCDDSSGRNPLSPVEMAQKIKECKDNNLSYTYSYYMATGEVASIYCRPPKDK